MLSGRHGLKYFSRLLIPIERFCHFFFRFDTLNGATQAPVVDLLRSNSLRDTKTAILTTERYKHPCPSNMGLHPSPDTLRVTLADEIT